MTMTGYAQGTWAPTLRYHNGTYYVFVCTPFEGLFMWHAKNPAGPWSQTDDRQGRGTLGRSLPVLG